MKRIGTIWCWHEWTEWSVPSDVKAIHTNSLTGMQTQCVSAMQQRRCLKCNRHERSWVRERRA